MLLDGQEFSNEVSPKLFARLADLHQKAEQVTYWRQRMVTDVFRSCNYLDRTCQTSVYDNFPELKQDLHNQLAAHKNLVYKQLFKFNTATLEEWVGLLKQGFKIATTAQVELQQRLNMDADKH